MHTSRAELDLRGADRAALNAPGWWERRQEQDVDVPGKCRPGSQSEEGTARGATARPGQQLLCPGIPWDLAAGGLKARSTQSDCGVSGMCSRSCTVSRPYPSSPHLLPITQEVAPLFHFTDVEAEAGHVTFPRPQGREVMKAAVPTSVYPKGCAEEPYCCELLGAKGSLLGQREETPLHALSKAVGTKHCVANSNTNFREIKVPSGPCFL